MSSAHPAPLSVATAVGASLFAALGALAWAGT